MRLGSCFQISLTLISFFSLHIYLYFFLLPSSRISFICVSFMSWLLPLLFAPSSCNKICQNLSRLSAISSSNSNNSNSTAATSQTHQQHLAHTKWAQRQHHHAHYGMIINLRTSFWALGFLLVFFFFTFFKVPGVTSP